MPKITVLMPVYNAEKFLRKAIDSILNQTFKDFEFLIINDGSTDKTSKILQNYHDPRMVIINNKTNIGLTKSLNNGLKIAKGKYIARMDADDISLPNRLEKQLFVMEKDSNVGLVASWITLIDENGNNKHHWYVDRKNNSPEEIFYTLLFENCLAHSSVIFKKDIVMKIGGYNEFFKKAQDYELWTRLVKISKIIKIKEPQIKYRIYPEKTRSAIVDQQSINVEKIFLSNVDILISQKIDPEILLSVKYNNSIAKVKNNNLFEVLRTFSNINRRLIASAPRFLDKEKLTRCGFRKRNTIIKKFVIRKLKLNLIFVIDSLLRSKSNQIGIL